MTSHAFSGLRKRFDVTQYVDRLRAGDRVVLARAITLVESELAADQERASRLLEAILPFTGGSRRVGITGVPGVGKSTFIDVLGMHLVRERAERVAVLTIDPSSTVSRGSILGDKTRMERLSVEERAFIRPSPSRGHLGGVAPRTREALLLCEAAGFENVLVETVGVGQSETAVRSVTDFFLLLLLPGAGDELQGIKRGIIEMTDGIAITKTDGTNRLRAQHARSEYAGALHLLAPRRDGWIPPVLTCSALTGDGVAAVWGMVLEHEQQSRANGQRELTRRRQAIDWMHELVTGGLEQRFRSHPEVARRLPALEEAVRDGRISSVAAARDLLQLFESEAR